MVGILLSPYTWHSIIADPVAKDVVFATCLTEKSETAILEIHNVVSYCYLELPPELEKLWNYFVMELNQRFKIIESKLVDRISTDDQGYYTDTPRKFLKIGMYSQKATKNLKYSMARPYKVGCLSNRVMKFNVRISPLELELNLCNNLKLDMSGWIEIPTDSPSEIQTNGILRYKVSSNILKKTTSNCVPIPKILSFDIEVANSKYHTMPDSMPKVDRQKDVAFLYGATVKKGDVTEYYAFCTGEHGDANFKNKLVTIPGVVIKYFTTELAMYRGIAVFIRKTCPNIIIGWNTYVFDFSYMFNRIKSLNNDNIDFMLDTSVIEGLKANLEQKVWESSAYGKQDMVFPRIPGILNIDLLKIVARDPAYRFEDNKLGTVSKALLGEDKNEMQVIEISQAFFESGVSPTKVIQYCVQDTKLPIRIFEKLNTWINLREFSNIVNVPFDYLFLRGQQIKMVSTLMRLSDEEGYLITFPEKRSDPTDTDEEEDSFTGALVFNTKNGFYKFVVSLDFRSLYPTIILENNICYTTIMRDPVLVAEEAAFISEQESILNNEAENEEAAPIPEQESQAEQTEESGSPALVSDVSDQKSPAENEEYENTEIKKPENTDYKVIEWEDQRETKESKRKRKAVKTRKPAKEFETVNNRNCFTTKRIGLLPKIVNGWLQARDATRAKQKDYQYGSLDWSVLEGRQLAYKVSANSVYGALGASKGYLPLPEGAASVTAVGRKMISFTLEVVEKEYGGVVIASDTDSAMFYLPGKTFEETDKLGKEIAASITSRFNSKYIKLNHEETKYQFLGLGKKLYFYKVKDPKTGKVSGLKSKGTAAVRRDKMEITREIVKGVAEMIFDEKSRTEVDVYLAESCRQIITRNVDVSKLYTPVGIKDEYKVKNAQVKLRDKIIEREGELISGDKYRTVFIKIPSLDKYSNYKKDASERVEFLDYYLMHREEKNLVLDYAYSFTKIVNAVAKILRCTYGIEYTSVDGIFEHLCQTQKMIKEFNDLLRPQIAIWKNTKVRQTKTALRTPTTNSVFLTGQNANQMLVNSAPKNLRASMSPQKS